MHGRLLPLMNNGTDSMPTTPNTTDASPAMQSPRRHPVHFGGLLALLQSPRAWEVLQQCILYNISHFVDHPTHAFQNLV
jgi:hypothetical protein